MRALLVTGSAGFIGYNFLQHLNEDPNNLIDKYTKLYFIDKVDYANDFNDLHSNHYLEIINSHDKFTHITADINDTNLCYCNIPNIKNYQWDILDFACESHVDNSISAPYKTFSENACITAAVVNIFGVDNINHIYHAATSEVYGDLPLEYRDDSSKWFSPDSLINPINPYSASKAAQDCFLLAAQHTMGLNVTLFRMGNQFGAHQHTEKLMPATIMRAMRGETIKIYGTGENIRQWTPVKDTVKYLYEMIYNERNDKVIHFAHPTYLMTNNEVINIWTQYLKDSYSVTSEIEYITDRLGHDRMAALSGTAEGLYNVDIEERFKETIDYYVELHYNETTRK